MSEEVVFIKLPCGCEWSPVAGLHQVNTACDKGEDDHQVLIKAELAKQAPK